MFDWLKNYFARLSPEFKAQAEEIKEQAERIQRRESADLNTIIQYEDMLKSITRDRDEFAALAESRTTALEESRMRLDKLRQTKHALERETSELRERLALAIPINAVGNMLKSSQYAGIFVNSDDMVLFSNKHANAYFGKTLEGKSLMEVIPMESMDLLKERLERERIGFKINTKGSARNPIYGWHVAVARDNQGFYGYTLSNERGFVQRLKALFSSAKRVGEYTTSKGGVLVPKPISLTPQ